MKALQKQEEFEGMEEPGDLVLALDEPDLFSVEVVVKLKGLREGAKAETVSLLSLPECPSERVLEMIQLAFKAKYGQAKLKAIVGEQIEF
jgi:hypothetical protein